MTLSLLPLLIPIAVGVALATVALEILSSPRPEPLQYYQYSSPSSSKAKSQSNHQKRDSNKSKCSCRMCGADITDKEGDLTKLPCDHQFHLNCISRHFKFRKNDYDEAVCPVSGCNKKYTLSE